MNTPLTLLISFFLSSYHISSLIFKLITYFFSLSLSRYIHFSNVQEWFFILQSCTVLHWDMSQTCFTVGARPPRSISIGILLWQYLHQNVGLKINRFPTYPQQKNGWSWHWAHFGLKYMIVFAYYIISAKVSPFISSFSSFLFCFLSSKKGFSILWIF